MLRFSAVCLTSAGVLYLGGLKACSCSDVNARDSCGRLTEPPVIPTVCKGVQSKSVWLRHQLPA